MVGVAAIAAGATSVALGIFYQFVLKDQFFMLGITRHPQIIQEFPDYTCWRLGNELLQGCEDLWLDHQGRRLYAACSDSKGRDAWSPGGSAYNVSGRKETDHFSVLNIDDPGPDGLYGLHALSISGNYKSSSGAHDIDLHGFEVEKISDSKLRFLAINHRPNVDSETGELMDGLKYGANSTIEVFEHVVGSKTLEWVETIFEPEVIETPNNLVSTGDGGILVTNDHSAKLGLRRELGMFIGGGSLAYYSPSGIAQLITPQPDPTSTFSPSKFYFPNGLARGKDGLFYMSDSGTGKISVFTLSKSDTKQGILTQIDSVDLKIPIDNLSVDSDGTIWAACFPKVVDMMIAMVTGTNGKEGVEINDATTVMSVRRVGEGGRGNAGWKGGYVVEKVVEDGQAKILPMATSVVNDVAGRKLWLGGVKSEFLGVCERNV